LTRNVENRAKTTFRWRGESYLYIELSVQLSSQGLPCRMHCPHNPFPVVYPGPQSRDRLDPRDDKIRGECVVASALETLAVAPLLDYLPKNLDKQEEVAKSDDSVAFL
jgi:hypothetical protein